MKKILFALAIVLSLVFTSCDEPDPTPTHNSNMRVTKISGTSDDEHTETFIVYHLELDNGHKILAIKTEWRGESQWGGIMHDPDCPRCRVEVRDEEE